MNMYTKMLEMKKEITKMKKEVSNAKVDSANMSLRLEEKIETFSNAIKKELGHQIDSYLIDNPNGEYESAPNLLKFLLKEFNDINETEENNDKLRKELIQDEIAEINDFYSLTSQWYFNTDTYKIFEQKEKQLLENKFFPESMYNNVLSDMFIPQTADDIIDFCDIVKEFCKDYYYHRVAIDYKYSQMQAYRLALSYLYDSISWKKNIDNSQFLNYLLIEHMEKIDKKIENESDENYNIPGFNTKSFLSTYNII